MLYCGHGCLVRSGMCRESHHQRRGRCEEKTGQQLSQQQVSMSCQDRMHVHLAALCLAAAPVKGCASHGDSQAALAAL